MKIITRYGLAAALTYGWAWLGYAQDAAPLDGVAAYVNDQVVLVSDVLALFSAEDRRLASYGSEADVRRRFQEAWPRALNQAIDRRLILEEFKRVGASVPDRVVEEEIAALIAERFNGDRDAFLDALESERMTMDEFRTMTRDSIAVTLMRRQYVGQRVRISPAAVRAAYEARQDRYRTPESVRLRMLVLQAGRTPEERAVKRAEAERLRAAAAAGESFAALARQHSEGARAADGGDLGWVEPRHLRPELAVVASRLPVGQVSEVIETPQEFFLLYLEARKAESVQPFEAVREALERELSREEEERLYQQWLARLRGRHTVRVLQPEWPENW